MNIGGISNVTYLPPGGGLADIRAFDTGPGNMVSDAVVRHATKGADGYDQGGRLAARGKVHRRLLDELMAHPFLARRPPNPPVAKTSASPV